jgi:hypothetical protein
MLLAIQLCDRAEQLAAWWDWPPHRDARWHLTETERAQATAARTDRLAQLQHTARAA